MYSMSASENDGFWQSRCEIEARDIGGCSSKLSARHDSWRFSAGLDNIGRRVVKRRLIPDSLAIEIFQSLSARHGRPYQCVQSVSYLLDLLRLKLYESVVDKNVRRVP